MLVQARRPTARCKHAAQKPQKDRTRRRLVLLTIGFLCLVAVACVGLVARSLGLCEFVSDGALLFFPWSACFPLSAVGQFWDLGLVIVLHDLCLGNPWPRLHSCQEVCGLPHVHGFLLDAIVLARLSVCSFWLTRKGKEHRRVHAQVSCMLSCMLCILESARSSKETFLISTLT